MKKLTEKAFQLSLELFDRVFDEDSRKTQYHFSFLFLRNKVISIGLNDYEISAKSLYFAERFNVPQKKKWPSLHSEIDAISKLWGKYPVGPRLKLVNIRFLKSGLPGMAKPCSDCSEVLKALGINEIYWSTNDGFNRG